MTNPPLNTTEAEILYLIWKRKKLGDGTPMTLKDIHGALVKHRRGKQSGLSLVAVKKVLQNLKARPAGLLEAIEVSHSGSGPRPLGYRLAPEKIITWPSTAAIVLALYNYPDHGPLERERFIEHIAGLGLVNEPTQAAPTKGQIEAQISACTQWNYIAEDQAGRLSSTRRVDDELEFLKAIANPGADIGHGVSRR